jgi:hypothetical protein
MNKLLCVLFVLVAMCLASLVSAEPGVFINKDPLPSGTTYYVLLDHTDQTNFKHSDATATGTVYIDDLLFSGLNATVKLGYITAISGSSANIEWFENFCVGSSTGSVSYTPRVPRMLNSTQTQLVGAVEVDTNVTTASIFAIYSTSTTTPGVGDIIIKATNDGTAAKFNLMMQYYTLP